MTASTPLMTASTPENTALAPENTASVPEDTVSALKKTALAPSKTGSSQKSKYRRYTTDQLATAVMRVKGKELSIKKAAKLYNIPVMTISDHVNNKVLWGKSFVDVRC